MIKFFRHIPDFIRILYLLNKYKLLGRNKGYFTKGVRTGGQVNKLGTSLASFFKSLGPIYIKFGQTLSTRPDLIGEDVALALRDLQDKLEPFSSNIARSKIEKYTGQKICDIFDEFEDKPVAAASIAQVHRARLKSGQQVAIKLLRPDIFHKYNQDIRFLEYLAHLLTKFTKKAKRLKPVEVIAVFKESMMMELNLQLEAAAASRIYDNFISDEMLYIPKIYWQFTSQKMITLEWIDGVSIYDLKKIRSMGLNPRELARKISVIFFNQAFRDGFFHADLHPGNILVRPDGRIALVDFGIIGILPEEDRLAIAEILYAFITRDYSLVAEVHHRAGYIPKDTNLELFAQSCRAIAEPILGLSAKDISIGNLLAQLFQVTENFGMETQSQLLFLQKTMVVVEGIGKALDKNINMWQLAEPWIKEWAENNISAKAKIIRFLKKLLKGVI